MTDSHYITRIRNLNTNQKCTLIARIVDKSNKSTFKNGKTMFHIDLLDREGDAIRGKFWGASADKWYPTLEKGKVYTFRGVRVIVANKNYSNIDCHVSRL